MPGRSQKNSKTFGAADYRGGALERLAESGLLLRAEYFAGSVYLAGRAVEAMLRAVIWISDNEIRTHQQTLDTGHDLTQLLSKVANLGLLKEGDRDDAFRISVQQVARLWYNNMRFASNKKVEAGWRSEVPLRNNYTFKKAATEYYNSCSTIIKRCEALL